MNRIVIIALLSATAAAACGAPSEDGDGEPDARVPAGEPAPGAMGGGMAGMHRRMMGGEAGSAPEVTAAQASAEDCADVDQPLVDQGRLVFNGPGGCTACHGADATGTALAPNLTDRERLNVDGSYGALAALVNSGVPQPKSYPAPMPPKGGADLSADQVCAVAAYVYSLSHGAGG